MIDVSKAQRIEFLTEAGKWMKEKGVKTYSQDVNAIVGFRELAKMLPVSDLPKQDQVRLLGLLKLLGNASANRQALEKMQGGTGEEVKVNAELEALIVEING
jgi:hypothetical protein